MNSTDPIADLFTSLRNASSARLDAALVPDSRFKQEVLKALQSEGFIKSFKTVGSKGAGRKIEVAMAYGPKREKLLNGIKRVSRPGRRVYVGADELAPLMRQVETPFLSTSRGVFAAARAKSENLGGELLCLAW